jgi:hypothetical protein
MRSAVGAACRVASACTPDQPLGRPPVFFGTFRGPNCDERNKLRFMGLSRQLHAREGITDYAIIVRTSDARLSKVVVRNSRGRSKPSFLADGKPGRGQRRQGAELARRLQTEAMSLCSRSHSLPRTDSLLPKHPVNKLPQPRHGF